MMRSYSRRNLVTIFSMAWTKIVMQHFLIVYRGISTGHVYFLGFIFQVTIANDSTAISGNVSGKEGFCILIESS